MLLFAFLGCISPSTDDSVPHTGLATDPAAPDTGAPEEDGSAIVDLVTTTHASCVVTRAGEVWCWGGLEIGGGVASGERPYRLEGLPPVRALHAQEHTMIAELVDGTTLGWTSWDVAWEEATRTRRVIDHRFAEAGVLSADVGGTSFHLVYDDGRVVVGYTAGDTWYPEDAGSGEGAMFADEAGNWCLVRSDGGATCTFTDALEAPGSVARIALGTTSGAYVDAEGVVSGYDWATRAWSALPDADATLDLTAGIERACGIRADGTVSCWGAAATEDVTGLAGIVDVDGRSSHVCALDAGGSVWCWGDDTFGQSSGGAPTGGWQTTPAEILGLP